MEKHPLNCSLCHELLVNFELLDCEEKQLVDEHLSSCKDCEQEYRFLQDLDEVFKMGNDQFDISDQVISKISRRRLAESNFPAVSILCLVVVLQIGMLMVVPSFSAAVFQSAGEWLTPAWEEMVDFSGQLLPEIAETFGQVVPVDSGVSAMGSWSVLIGLVICILLLNGAVYLTAREKGHL